MLKYIIYIAVAILLTIIFHGRVTSLSYNDYKDTLGALLNISSIIFAIIGAWIAIIYPRAMARILNKKNASNVNNSENRESNKDANYLSELVEIVMVSAVVLMAVLLIQFFAPILKGLIVNEYLPYVKYLNFTGVSFLTIAQFTAIFRVILVNYFFLNELRKKNVDDTIDQLHR
ncbi:hypothetical protein PO857_003141 [Pectobacterium carotovorum]|uniref:hypothetical protein n=1 Tax=Pectobacterium carotovorum TaxID=554 RepID=UPI00254F146B|nr:hypothetical protein [Pectobacterium carotovorum]MDK9420829.1 hypothetical protein [Pectobacterium carotovorum]